MGRRSRHMHTVPAGYLRAFADESAKRRRAHVWRFERTARKARLISVRDASVSSDIYLLRKRDGTADMTIEERLLGAAVESGFPGVVAHLTAGRGMPAYWQLRDMSRFMAFQLARTPRWFQLLRDEWTRQGLEVGLNDPKLAMVRIAPFLETWTCEMRWSICRNASTLPFVTSDNPVAMWADRGGGAEIGVGFTERSLEIVFPLTPVLCLQAVQTERSAAAVARDLPDDVPRFTDVHSLRIYRKDLGIDGVVKANQVTVANADQYVYANRNQENVRLFLGDLFYGWPNPVRRFDLRPIGSDCEPESGAAGT